MQNLRKAAQQALEYIEQHAIIGGIPIRDALRAALNQERYVVTGNEFHGAPPEPYANWGDAIAAMIDSGVIQGLQISAMAEDRSADTGKTSDHFPDAGKMVATIRPEVTVEPVATINEMETVEPVAWATVGFVTWGNRQIEKVDKLTREAQPEYGFVIPLYTAPPKHKPLTDAEIGAVAADIWGSILIAPQSYQQFARAIEQAHGIGGGEE